MSSSIQQSATGTAPLNPIALHQAVNMRKMVLQGCVLAGDGSWVDLNEAVRIRTTWLTHLDRGEILSGSTWVTMEKTPRPLPARKRPARPGAAADGDKEALIEVSVGRIVEEPETVRKAAASIASDRESAVPAGTALPRQEVTARQSGLALHEAISQIVGTHGAIAPSRIRHLLREPRFGGHRVGFFMLRGMLKTMHLATKSERYRYYRSY